MQGEFTHVTAALFFDRKPEGLQGEALVVANSLVVFILLAAALRSIGIMGVELRELQLTFVDDKSVVQLPVFNDKFATHLCAATLPILAPGPPGKCPPLLIRASQVHLAQLEAGARPVRRAQEPAVHDAAHM